MRCYETSTELITDCNMDVHSQPRTLPCNTLQELSFFANVGPLFSGSSRCARMGSLQYSGAAANGFAWAHYFLGAAANVLVWAHPNTLL